MESNPIITAHAGAPRAVFLDRDGVILNAVVRDGKPYPPATAADMEIAPDADAALAELKRGGFLLIVVTNQPDVARGRQSRAAVEEMHAAMAAALPLDDILVCWHDDPDACECRKPRPGLLEAAARKHGIDLRASYMVGDRWGDVDAGHNAGCTTVLIDRGYAERPPAHPPHARAASLGEAARWILTRPLDVIIPFYGNAPVASALFASLATVQDELAAQRCRVLAVNDSPGDAALGEVLHAATEHSRLPFDIAANARNLGFVASANIGLQRAVAAGHDALLLNSDTVVFPGAIAEMRRVAALDPMIGFVNPRSNNASIYSLPPYAGPDPQAAHAAYRKLARHLPEFQFVPTGVGFCLLIRHEVLEEFGVLDECYSPGYSEENDLIMRANRRGFRAALANRAFVYHQGSGSFRAPEAEALERRHLELLCRRYPEYQPAVARYCAGPQHQAERLLPALLPDANGRLALLFDLSGLEPVHNGTSMAARRILERAVPAWRDTFKISVAVRDDARRFHRLDEIEGLSFAVPGSGQIFAVAFRFGQPYRLDHISRLNRAAPVNVYAMLDPIALDCQYLGLPDLEPLWAAVFSYADGVVYISDFAAGQFGRRFRRREELRELVCPLSLDVRDYAPGLVGGHAPGDYILVAGNSYEHKHVRPTAEALKRAFPGQRIVAIGIEPGAAPGVECRPGGALDAREIQALLQGARVIVFPSFYEGFGLPIMEGLAHRKSVLARDTGAARELRDRADAGENLLLYGSTAELIARLKTGIPQWKEMPPPHDTHDWDAAARQLETFLRELVESFSFERALLPRMEYLCGIGNFLGPDGTSLRERDEEIAGLRRSMSWRVTAPMRALGGAWLRFMKRR